jgi:hypothetical protein
MFLMDGLSIILPLDLFLVENEIVYFTTWPTLRKYAG